MIALYLRVSTDKQKTGLESQERYLVNYCKSNQIRNYLIYSDNNISGSKSSRPELNKLMKDVRDGKISKVIVYSFSRFARSTTQLLQALDEFHNLGVEFISLNEKIDTTSATGKAMFTIISAISQLERELVSERVKAGLENARAKGKQIGRKKTRNSKLIRVLAKQKYSQREIAKLAGCSKTTVQRELCRS